MNRRRDIASLLLASVCGHAPRNHPLLDSPEGQAELTRAAEFHRVTGSVVEGLKAGGARVPDALWQAHLRNVSRHLRTLADLAVLAEVLRARGLPWLAMKGPVLAECFYERPDARSYVDLDVIVPQASFEETFCALEASGVSVVERNWSLAREQVFGEVHLALPHGTGVDLHWHIFNQRRLRDEFPVSMEEIHEAARTVDVAGLGVRTLGATFTMVHTALHACMAGGNRLVWMRDLQQLILHDDPQWDEVIAVCKRWHAELPVGLMLARALRTLDAPVPDDVIGALLPRRRWRLATSVIDRLSPVATATTHGSVARITARAMRSTERRSLSELRRRTGSQLAARVAHRHPDGDLHPASILDVQGGPEERAAYFHTVRESSG